MGRYIKEKDAALIYDYMANKLFKEFAYLNFPNELLTEKEFNKINVRRKKLSKYIGITYHKRDKKWCTSIIINNKNKFLGYYKTELGAALARDKYIIDNNLNIKKHKLNLINNK